MSLRWVVPCLLAAASALGCATSEPAPPSGAGVPAAAGEPAAAPASAGAGQPAPPAAGTLPFEPLDPGPPDGKWLLDDQGREYYVKPVPRLEDYYQWVDPERKRVRLLRGIVAYVESYDDEYIYIRIFRPIADPRDAPRGNDEEERQRVAASYRAESRASDRIRLVPFSNGLPTEGQWRNGFDLADVNGDGQWDIVHGPPRKGGARPRIFLGDGRGNWRPWDGVSFPAVPFDYGDAVVADFNGDRHADLALACHLRGVVAMIGDGAGGFRLWSQGIEFGEGADRAAPFSSRALAAHDWNRDGRPDLIAVGEGPHLSVARGAQPGADAGTRGVVVYLNQGDGSWVGRELEGEHLFGDAIAVGDIDGDGIDDLATAAAIMEYQEIVSLGRADGSAQPVAIGELRPEGIVRSVALADFDGDGKDDLAVGYTSKEGGPWRGGIDLFSRRADGGWLRRTMGNEEALLAISALDTGDLDGDGALDLAGVDSAGKVWLFLGDGKGGFSREATPEASSADPSCGGYGIRLADVDGDGRSEVFAGFAGEGLDPVSGSILCPSQGSLRAWKVAASPERARS